MDYSGTDYPEIPRPWHPWKKQFLLFPKIIDGRIYWLRTVYRRFRLLRWATNTPNKMFEYQYAVDVFDLMKKDSDVLC